MSNPIEAVYNAQTKKAIYDWGRNISVIYGSTAVCNSCSYDPIAKEATNVACSTCDGKYYYQTENTLGVKGVLKTFLGNLSFRDYSLKEMGFFPQSDARLTCWLSDVLLTDSATGFSYLDEGRNIRVEVDGKKYIIDSTQRTGAGELKVIVCALKEIK